MFSTLEGLDHVMVVVHNLNEAAERWRALGFTLSPRGVHSPYLGSGNHTVMFGVDYIELLGILNETAFNAPSRAFLDQRGEGVERAAITTNDAAAGVTALRAVGIEAQGPVKFSRPVELPDGGSAEAAFSVFHWPYDQDPAGLRVFACQHHSRDIVWIPELQSHPNTATGIVRIEVVSPFPASSAEQFAALIDGKVQPCEDGASVETAPGRAKFFFLTKDTFIARRPLAQANELPVEGVVALVLRVDDLDAATRWAGAQSHIDGSSAAVAADRANGVMLVFER